MLTTPIKQMAGSKHAFENREQAFRLATLAQQRYMADNPEWNDDLDTRLRSEYDGDYDADREYIRHAYRYNHQI